jgi:WXG100 family type VII secretion target
MGIGIAVTPERLRDVSAQMSAAATEVESILHRVTNDVAPVRAEWSGAAQAEFEGLWDQLQRDAKGVHSVLTGIAKLTQNAATSYEAAEQAIVKSFSEFRVEMDKISEGLSRVQQIVANTGPEIMESEYETEIDETFLDENEEEVDMEATGLEYSDDARPSWSLAKQLKEAAKHR